AAAWETRAPHAYYVGSLVLPYAEDGEVVRPDVRRSRQTVCDEATRLIRHHKVEPSVGADVHACVCLIIQREWEWQRDWRIAVVTETTDVGIARHDRVGALGYGVLARRATLYRVISREVGTGIAINVGDRPGGNMCSQAPTKWDVQRELGSH